MARQAKKPKQELFPNPSDQWEMRAAYSVLRGWVTAEFLEAWQQWVKHRKEIRKNLTETAVMLQLEQCRVWGHERAIAAIRHSIMQGYRGLFEPPGKGGQPFQGIKDFLG